MTALQMNAEMLRKLAAEKQTDPTAFSQKDFFDRIENARNQPGRQFASVEELDQYIRSL